MFLRKLKFIKAFLWTLGANSNFFSILPKLMMFAFCAPSVHKNVFINLSFRRNMLRGTYVIPYLLFQKESTQKSLIFLFEHLRSKKRKITFHFFFVTNMFCETLKIKLDVHFHKSPWRGGMYIFVYNCIFCIWLYMCISLLCIWLYIFNFRKFFNLRVAFQFWYVAI